MAKKKHEKSKFRIYLEFIPFWVLYQFIHLLPLKTGYKLSGLLFRLLLAVDRRHRVRTIQHLLHAGVAKDEAEARRIATRSLLEFSKLFVEIVKMDQLYSPERIRAVGSPSAVDQTFPTDREGGQVIIVTAHYGNWEVAGTAFSELARRPMSSFMRPFGNPLVGKMILNHRAGSMHELIDKREGIRPILRAAARGRNITMLIDQHAAGNEGIECEFFGHPARVHMTPALLHLKTGLPILPELTRRVPGDDFRFELVVGDLIRYTPTGDKQRDVQAISQLCISALEKMIREEPEQWLWAPRHWLDLNRRGAENYKDWKPPFPPPQADKASAPAADVSAPPTEAK